MLDLEAAPSIESGTRILVIVAHHDDIEFGMAGSVAKWKDAGAEVTYCIITDGSAGNNEPDAQRAATAQTRRVEQLAAAKLLDVQDVRFLDYMDGELQPTMKLRRELTRVIREVQPDMVVCQDPSTMFFGDGYINHPDHRAAGEAAIYATFPSAESRPIFAELLDEGHEPHKVEWLYMSLTNNPTHYVDISHYIDHKIASLKAHESQIGTSDEADAGAAKYIKERNAESGEKVGVKYAEFYKVMHLVRADDVDEDALQAAASDGEVNGASGSDDGSSDDAKMTAPNDDTINTDDLQESIEGDD